MISQWSEPCWHKHADDFFEKLHFFTHVSEPDVEQFPCCMKDVVGTAAEGHRRRQLQLSCLELGVEMLMSARARCC